MAKNKKTKQPIVKNFNEAAKALEVLFATDYVDKKKLYTQNFLRGIALGAGSVIGATVVITLVLWILSLFDTTPLIGPLFENTQDTIRKNR